MAFLLLIVALFSASNSLAGSASNQSPESESESELELGLGAELDLEDCTLAGSAGIANVEASCGWLQRFEDPDDPESQVISLRFALIKALSPNPQPDAFTVINGGPGGSSLDMYADSAGIYRTILRDRDIFIIDQRGTGASNPLDCPDLEATDVEYTPELIHASTQACLDSLSSDPRFYTTSIAVRDLEALRLALGYSALNVYGVSYGTRVAQHYARRYPEATRTLIIDGVVPPQIPLGPNAAINAQRTLDRMFARCAEEPACAGRFPDIDAQLATLRTSLEEDSVALQVAHPVSGVTQPVELNYNHLVLTLRMLSYVPETASLLPLIIDQAQSQGNYVPLATNALRIERDMLGAIRFGMHNSVICAEDVPFLAPLDQTALEATYMGPTQAESLLAICKLWPRGPVDDDLREPLRTEVPTLILSGEEDPITPPEYGHMADQQLPNSLHLIGGGQGHGVVTRGCFPRLLSNFVDSADLMSLDTSCVDRLRHQPFFLNLLGPVPRPDPVLGPDPVGGPDSGGSAP